MADSVIRSLLVRLGVDADTAKAKAFDAAIGGVKKAMLAAGAVVAGLGAGLLAITKSVADVGDAAAKTAQQVGLTAEQVQELSYAAELSGTSFDVMRVGLLTMSRNTEAAARGAGEAKDALGALGVGVKQADGKLKPSLALMEEIATALAGMEDQSLKTTYAQRIFGEAGAKMLPFLNAGAEGIEAMRREAQALGFVMSNETAAQSEKFNDSLTRARRTVEGLKMTVGAALLPVLTDLLDQYRDWFLLNRDLIAQRVREWSQKAAEGFEKLGDAFEWMSDHKEALTAIFGAGGILWGLAKLATIITALQEAWVALSGAWAAGAALMGVSSGVLGLLVAAVVAAIGYITALGLILQDLWVYFQGGKSAMGELIERGKEAGGILGQIARLAEVNLAIFRRLAELIGGALSETLDYAAGKFGVLARHLKPLTDGIARLAGHIGDMVGKGFEIWLGEVISLLETLLLALTDPGAALDQLSSKLESLASKLERIFAPIIAAAQAVGAGAAGLAGGIRGGIAQTGMALATPGVSPAFAVGAFKAATGMSGPVGQVARTVQMGTVNIQGIGLDARQAENMIRSVIQEQTRQANAIFEGVEL